MTKDDFKRIPELRKEIRKALIMWENAKESATRTTTILTGMPKGNNVSSQIENAVVKAEVYHERYNQLNDELKDIYTRLEKESSKLSDLEKDVLILYYPQAKKMSVIAKEKSITERHAYRLKKDALKKICV